MLMSDNYTLTYEEEQIPNKTVILHNGFEILISPDHYDHLSRYKLSINRQGYINIFVDNKIWQLHRYIMINLLNNPINSGLVVDHINNNRKDNRIENLRILSRSDNSRNRIKSKNKTSEYYGVHYVASKWRAQIKINNTSHLVACYNKELHAAHQYNLWVLRYNLLSKINDIIHPNDFIEYKPRTIKKLYPKGINLHGNRFRVTISINKRSVHIDSCATLDDAIQVKKYADITKNNYKLLLQELNIRFNRRKNINGNYYFIINDKEIIIDKDMYPLMYKNTWHITHQNYVRTNGKLLSRIIMNCNDPELFVDHINGNRFDNRKCNLRIVTPYQNSLNRNSSKNSSSEYIGVYRYKGTKKWAANITINGKNKHLGVFEREQDAALARDYATKQHFKEFGKLNFPKRQSWDEQYMELAEVIKLRSPDHHKVGSVLVSIKDNRIISTGYNSVPAGLDDDNINWSDRNFINDVVIHSEMNALLYSQSKFEDTKLYTTTSPCINCLKLLSATNIKKIIYKHEYRDFKRVEELANFFNIELVEYENVI
jgi:dCMP deaminase